MYSPPKPERILDISSSRVKLCNVKAKFLLTFGRSCSCTHRLRIGGLGTDSLAQWLAATNPAPRTLTTLCPGPLSTSLHLRWRTWKRLKKSCVNIGDLNETLKRKHIRIGIILVWIWKLCKNSSSPDKCVFNLSGLKREFCGGISSAHPSAMRRRR